MTPPPRTPLEDLPAPLWSPLLRAVRRAVERLDRSELPAGLRPFATWKPERLTGQRPRTAVAEALIADSRLREYVGEALDDQDAFAAARDSDPRRLAATYGDETAAAALVARGRWDALAVVAADASDRLVARERAGAEASARRTEERAQQTRRRADQGLASAREERDAARRRADAAEQRLQSEEATRQRLEQEVADLRGEVLRLQAELDTAQREHARRVVRLQRRADRAERQHRSDDARALRVAADLEALAGDLREAIHDGAASEVAESERLGIDDTAGAEDAGGLPVIPRDVAAAVAGRPARLPPGLTEDDPKAVRALLQVPGLHLVLDGYNVSMDARGLPHATLSEQRHWLVRRAAAVGARHRLRTTVVFDATDPVPGRLPAARGVAVVFTTGEETADDRIVALVTADPETPTLVISSDREVRDGCRAVGANVAAAGAFLRAT